MTADVQALIARLRNCRCDARTGAAYITWDAVQEAADALTAAEQATRTLQAETWEEAFRVGFQAGFAISGEGWNAEYPFQDQDMDYAAEARWLQAFEYNRKCYRQSPSPTETPT